MKRLLLLLALAAPGAALVAADTKPTDRPAPVTTPADKTERTVRIAVSGMHCEMCAGSVKTFLKKVGGVTAVHVSVPQGLVLVHLSETNQPTDAQLKKAVFDAGFEATGVARSADDYDKSVGTVKSADDKKTPAKGK